MPRSAATHLFCGRSWHPQCAPYNAASPVFLPNGRFHPLLRRRASARPQMSADYRNPFTFTLFVNCGDCILLRAALRNRRSRLLFANYIRAFRAFSRSKNLTAVYAYRKAQETKFYRKLSPNISTFFGDVFSQDKENERRRTSVLQAKFDAVFGKLSPKPQHIFR